MIFKWVYLIFLIFLLPNFILMVGLQFKLLAFYVNYYHFLLAHFFLYYYSSPPGKRPGWLSLISKPRICFLKPFTSSYKDFKGVFFKILIEEEGNKYFFDGDTPKFPLYWTDQPLKFNSWSYHSMDAADRRVIEVFGHFSYQIPTRALLRLYSSETPPKDLIGM